MKKVKLSFVIMMIITMLMSCVACAKKTKCDYCGEMAKCQKVETLMGTEFNACEKCATILDSLQ